MSINCERCGRPITSSAGCNCTPPGVAAVAAVYGGGGVALSPPLNEERRRRDALWCYALASVLGNDVIDSTQLEAILKEFNRLRMYADGAATINDLLEKERTKHRGPPKA